MQESVQTYYKLCTMDFVLPHAYSLQGIVLGPHGGGRGRQVKTCQKHIFVALREVVSLLVIPAPPTAFGL